MTAFRGQKLEGMQLEITATKQEAAHLSCWSEHPPDLYPSTASTPLRRRCAELTSYRIVLQESGLASCLSGRDGGLRALSYKLRMDPRAFAGLDRRRAAVSNADIAGCHMLETAHISLETVASSKFCETSLTLFQLYSSKSLSSEIFA